MPEPLTDAYLAEIQARVDAARPLPWKTTQHDMDGLPLGFGPFSWVEAWTTEEIAPNIDFCNKARTDIPALLAEVARQRKENKRLEKAVREMHDGINRIANEANLREVAGGQVAAERVRVHAAELGVPKATVDQLLRDIDGAAAMVAPLPALPWAALLDADDLEGFLSDLATAADADDDLSTLAAVEKVIAEWRLIAVAQDTHNTAPGPDGGEPGGR